MSHERVMKVGHNDDLDFNIRWGERQGTRYFNLAQSNVPSGQHLIWE